MTKKELIEALKDYPDDMIVCAFNEYSHLVPIHHVGVLCPGFIYVALKSVDDAFSYVPSYDEWLLLLSRPEYKELFMEEEEENND